MTLNISASQISESESGKLLGVTLDPKLDSNAHVESTLCDGKSKTLCLSKGIQYIGTEKVILIMRSFIESHLSYCPLIWMFHDRATDICKIYKKT